MVASDYLGLLTVPLWEGFAPGAQGSAPEDVPTLTVFRPNKPNGTSVIIAPGGAYVLLMSHYEGREVADWYAARGVTAFVLKYRLGPRYRLPVILQDAQRAIRLVRAHAAEWNLSPRRVGMMGFSAGGHLTALTGTQSGPGEREAVDPIEQHSSRPDFMVLAYPVIRKFFVPDLDGNIGYCQAMQMNSCDPRPLERYLPADQVSPNMPPTFIYHTGEDETVPCEDPLRFYSALRAVGVPVEIHIFAHGAHGTGLGAGDPALSLWPTLLEAWLRRQGLLTPDPGLRAMTAEMSGSASV